MFLLRRFRRIYGVCVVRQNKDYINPNHCIPGPRSAFQEFTFRYYTATPLKTSSSSPATTACWNCKKTTVLKSHMICSECGQLQDVRDSINYFDLLDCPRCFDVEPQQLTQRFRQLQTIVHPDKFSNKSNREQSNSANWSSLINKAYKTLLTPIERGQYLLEMNGLQIPEDNSSLDKEFLMEMMERNEEVEDATTESELRQLDERIANELHEKSNKLIIQFNGNDMNGAMATLVKMKYLSSMRKTIKSKLQSLILSG